MRRPYLLAVAGVAVLGVGFWFGQAAAQSGAAPGSTQDPLASVSYVTQAIANALSSQVPSLVSQAIQTALPGAVAPVVQSNVASQLKTALPGAVAPVVQSTVASQLKAALANVPSGGVALTVVSVKPGEELIADQGTEFILRGGAAAVTLAATAQGGFVDLTSGQNLAQGAAVPQNQLLLAARSDGRGIVPVGSGRILVLVLGSYAVQAVR